MLYGKATQMEKEPEVQRREQIQIEEPYILDSDDARRLLRISAKPGDEVDGDFVKHKEELRIIYDALYNLLDGVARAGAFDAPDESSLYKMYRTFRRERGIHSPIPPPGEFTRMLIILASQAVPFIHILREINMNERGVLDVVTRYSLPLQSGKNNTVKLSCENSIKKSLDTIRSGVAGNTVFNDWGKVIESVKKQYGANEARGVNRERLDAILNKFSIKKDCCDTIQSNQLQIVNHIIQRYSLEPLLANLKKQNLAVFVSSSLDGDADTKLIGCEVNGFVYFNVPLKIQERQKMLCDVLLAEPVASQIGLSKNFRSSVLSEEEFFKECANFAESTLARRSPAEPFSFEISTLLNELIFLTEWQEMHRRKEKIKREIEEFNEAIAMIKEQGTIFYAMRNGKMRINKKFLQDFFAGEIPFILAVSEPEFKFGIDTDMEDIDWTRFRSIFVIYKDRQNCGNAIFTAVNLFNQSGDAYLVRLLERLLQVDTNPDEKLKEYIAPVHLLQLRQALMEIYSAYIPWYKKFWLFFLGREVDSALINQIREGLREAERKKRDPALVEMEKQLEQQQLMKNKGGQHQLSGSAGQSGALLHKSSSSLSENLVKKFMNELDEFWNMKNYPDRDLILRGYQREDTSDILNILHAVDENFEIVRDIIRIPVSGREPIFVTGGYLRKNREMLLADVREELSNFVPIGADSHEKMEKLKAIVGFLDRF